MPRKGFKSISIHEDVYQKVQDMAKCLGCSVAEATKNAIYAYPKSSEFQLFLDQGIKEYEQRLERLKALKAQ